jgi:hypothetical protein
MGRGEAHLELWVDDTFAHSVDVIEGVLCRAEGNERVQFADLPELCQVLHCCLHSPETERERETRWFVRTTSNAGEAWLLAIASAYA